MTMVLAVGVGAFAFAGDVGDDVTILGVTLAGSTWIGIASTVVLALTVIDVLLKWEERSAVHGHGIQQLAELKADYRAADASGPDQSTCQELTDRYDATMALLTPPPDRWMLKLKAYHERKVKVSKMISAHPGRPLPLLRVWAYWSKDAPDA